MYYLLTVGCGFVMWFEHFTEGGRETIDENSIGVTSDLSVAIRFNKDEIATFAIPPYFRFVSEEEALAINEYMDAVSEQEHRMDYESGKAQDHAWSIKIQRNNETMDKLSEFLAATAP